jgi:hypothetical protein
LLPDAAAATVRAHVRTARPAPRLTNCLAAILLATLAAAAGCKKSAPAAPAPTPDEPQGFGPRCVWLAFRGASPEAVARALDLRDAGPSTWADGLKAAYATRVFVTPPIDGWVLAASTRFPDPGEKGHEDKATPVLVQLSQALGEVQYFATHDGLELAAWARFVNGAPVRKIAWFGKHGLVIWADGEPTPEERKLGLAYTAKGLESPPYPNEANVFALAGAWSVDPSTLQARHLPASLGIVGSPP